MFDEVLLIGAFGRLVGLTPSALRFYDDCGLLQPANVDPATGYRLYRLEQERRAVMLRDLREMGLPLPAVRAVLDGDPQDAVRVIEEHVQQLEARLAPVRRDASSVLAALTVHAGGWRVDLSGPELASAIRQVSSAASTTSDVPALACVLLETDGDEVRLVATDRHQLGVRVLPARSGPATTRKVLVPAAALAALAAWLLRHELVTIAGGGAQLCVSSAGEVRELPVVDAAFPDYRALLARLAPAQARAVVDRLALLDVFLAGNLPTPVVIDVGDDQLVVSSPNGRTRHALSAVCTGDPVRLGFAPLLLAGCLAVSVGPDVLLELGAPNRAVVVRSADQGSFTVLAMPTLLEQGQG
jgi:DNA polymerase-3 subunit beta